MSRRNVIRHYMRSDTGGLLVWHIRDMLGIIMQWCQLKAWNALRGKLECFPCAWNSLRRNDGGRTMVCAEVTISTCVNSWWVIIELDGSSLSSYCMISSMKYNRSEVVMGEKNNSFPTDCLTRKNSWRDYSHLLVSCQQWKYFEVTRERAHLLSLVTNISPAPCERGFALSSN